MFSLLLDISFILDWSLRDHLNHLNIADQRCKKLHWTWTLRCLFVSFSFVFWVLWNLDLFACNKRYRKRGKILQFIFSMKFKSWRRCDPHNVLGCFYHFKSLSGNIMCDIILDSISLRVCSHNFTQFFFALLYVLKIVDFL